MKSAVFTLDNQFFSKPHIISDYQPYMYLPFRRKGGVHQYVQEVIEDGLATSMDLMGELKFRRTGHFTDVGGHMIYELVTT